MWRQNMTIEANVPGDGHLGKEASGEMCCSKCCTKCPRQVGKLVFSNKTQMLRKGRAPLLAPDTKRLGTSWRVILPNKSRHLSLYIYIYSKYINIYIHTQNLSIKNWQARKRPRKNNQCRGALPNLLVSYLLIS